MSGKHKKLKDYGIAHVGYVVKDLEKCVKKFEEYYEIDDFVIYDFTPNKVWSNGKEDHDYKLKIAMADVAGKECKIEIIQPVRGEGVHKDFIDQGHNGLHHIAFSVDNYDYWKEYFLNKGEIFIFESETEDEVKGYRRCFYARDEKIGFIYEVMEKPYFRK